MSRIRSHVMVCCGTGCTSSESPKIAEAFEKQLKLSDLDKEVKVVRTGCFGLCAIGPIVMIFPEGNPAPPRPLRPLVLIVSMIV